MIPLVKYTMLNEKKIKDELSSFIKKAKKLSMGKLCEHFEHKFANFQGRKHAILFNSGSSANLALLQALKNLQILKNNDSIGFSALTWATNVMPILQLGMKPIPIDIEIETMNISSKTLRKRIKDNKLKALFVTNVLGFTGDLSEIKNICNSKNIILLEDNCEALGTELFEGKSGNFGLASTFSFYVAHHMSTIEGGMVCTDNDDLAVMLKIVRAHGWDRNLTNNEKGLIRNKFKIFDDFYAKYTFYDLGYNLRPTEITGFIGLKQLDVITKNNIKRLGIYKKIYNVYSKNSDFIEHFTQHIKFLSPFAFPVICKTKDLREKYLKKFKENEIEIRPLIAGNITRQPFFKKYVKKTYSLKKADFIHENAFYFGLYPEMNKKEIELIKSVLIK
jgi:CDP-6-deoxy-D-xylo-4-hexulose-3-dehydrase